VKWILLFIAIQIVALILALVGLPIVALLALAHAWEKPGITAQWHWDVAAAWPWDNEVDGICAPGTTPTAWRAFYWSALRNPCNNFRFVPGVSKVGRPLWRKTWGAKPGGWYAQAGWNNSGFPVLSAGRNVNPW
jgi:hypothetical protein